MLRQPRLCLSDACWRRIADKIPDVRRCGGVGDVRTRRFVEAVLWIWRTGASWRDLPGFFGKWATVYKRFRRWALGAVWQTVHSLLLRREDRRVAAISIDSTSVRVHQHAAGGQGGARRNAIGRSRGGRTTKVHAAVEHDKRLVALKITAGEQSDIAHGPALVERALRRVRPGRVIADKGYDADAFVAWLSRRGIEAVIPPRRHRRTPRPFSREAYRQRNEVERFFAHAKQFRRLASRFDKTTASYRAGVLLVSAWVLVS